MKNTTILAIIGIVILAVGAFIYFNSNVAQADVNVNGNSNTDTNNENAQKVTLGIKNYNYYPNTITVKVNQPVEVTLDDSVVGCYRSFNIKELGVSKNARTPEDKIIFTPTKPGTYTFQCIMGMGYGKLIVK